MRRRRGRAINRPEQELQIACVAWFTLQYPKLAPYLHHSPNGGKRTRTEAGIFKAMGTRPGMPDLMLYYRPPMADWTGLAVEMKGPDGRLTQPQKDWLQRLKGEGWMTATCKDLVAFKDLVGAYLDTSNWPETGLIGD